MSRPRIGRIVPRDTVVLSDPAGSGLGVDGVCYEFTTLANTGEPVIRSGKTGRWFVLSWEAVIDLAIAAGINGDEVTKAPKEKRETIREKSRRVLRLKAETPT